MIDVRQVRAAVAQLSGVGELAVIQRCDDHIVFDAPNAIVKCGTRDDFGIEAWACERARSFGVPAPAVIAVETSAAIPFLALSKVAGVALLDRRVSDEVAARAARQAGALMRLLHEAHLPGFGWADRRHFQHTGDVRDKSTSWVAEVRSELERALEELVVSGALDVSRADALRDEMRAAASSLGTVTEGRFLHGDLGRIHIFIDPRDGEVTGFVDWGDVQVGDPVWDLAITAVHFGSTTEGLTRVHRAHQPDLFPELLAGYEPSPEVTGRLDALKGFYLAYRRAWVARLGPGEGEIENPSLTMLLGRAWG